MALSPSDETPYAYIGVFLLSDKGKHGLIHNLILHTNIRSLSL